MIQEDAYFSQHPEAYDQTPVDIGAAGGSVGLLDGSAAWRPIDRMRAFRTSQIWGADGSFGSW